MEGAALFGFAGAVQGEGRPQAAPPGGRASERSSLRWRSHRACGRKLRLAGDKKEEQPPWGLLLGCILVWGPKYHGVNADPLGVVRTAFRASKVHSGRWMAWEASGKRASGRWASLQVRM